MIKRNTNRTAWGLAVVLAGVVLVGAVALAANSQRGLPERERRVFLLPMREWGFRRQRLHWVGSTGTPITDIYRCGFFEVRLRHRSPARTPASARKVRGRPE
jgi:hypothetical protein